MRLLSSFSIGALIGVLGGLIGLGGAEFRLPVLVGVFKFKTIHAIMINLVVSLVTVCFSFLFRSSIVPYSQVWGQTPVILNLLAGSLLGSYAGVHFATRLNEKSLNRLVMVFLVSLGLMLVFHGVLFDNITSFSLHPLTRAILGALAGVVIGMFSSMLGVAGGELIIPTLLFLFAVDIKLAGSLSLAISIPTIIIGLTRYKTHEPFKVVRQEAKFIAVMAAGSIVGSFAGSHLLRGISGEVVKTFLGFILLTSAVKLFYSK
ncbi:sulfite exporter TauE/SafE family protein [Pelotomaculum propionicicum]|uniref:sulfite exporter TauE/SafE family protein n=1 Tax=Pelotomaculum propionicicum TaxID=258475 RepID=UPI0010665794|nr:sulfite exporter TauE/SafE family protein [Pelotomaculum propionicicum]NLI12268.1 sulfite exporter TauE/SafE family protein [Peptococcaceae bacterium]